MDVPPVQDAQPPKGLIRLANPIVAALLRSPLHRLVGKNLMLLTVTGRKSGRSYTLPVGRHQQPDGTLVVSAGGAWRHNLQDGSEVRVVLDGRVRTAHVTVEEDPLRAAEVFRGLLDCAGPRALAVKITGDHSPTLEEIGPVMANRVIAYLKLATL